MTAEKSKGEWALESLSRGLGVFPITWTEDDECSCGTDSCAHDRSRHGKHPMPGSRGFKDAVHDAFSVEEKWDEYPKANIGVYPGKGHVIIDVDRKNTDEDGETIDGLENLCNFLDVTREELLDMTYAVRTTSGGYHLYFKSEKSYPNSVNLIPGIDVRGVNGYVLGPGSSIHGKTYDIVNDVKIAKLPEDIAALLGRVKERDDRSDTALFEWDLPSAVERVRDLLAVRKPAIDGHGGNHHTYCTAALARDHAVSMEKLLEIVMEPGGWNSRCVPPWDYNDLVAPAGPFTNAYKYAKHRPGVKGEDVDALAALAEELEDEDDFFKVQDYAELEKKLEKDKESRKDRFRQSMFFGGQFMVRNHAYDMLIEDWVPAQGFTGVLGARGSGKSTVLVDMTMRIALDREFYGSQIDPGWTVCYIVGEDEAGLGARQRAWCIQNGLDPMNDIPPNRLITVEMPINLIDRTEVDEFLDVLREGTQDAEKILFVFDTWQRMTQRAESQSNEHDMAQAITNVEYMSKSVRGPSIGAFHPPKNNADTISGSSLIENTSHAILQVADVGAGNRILRSTRIKGAQEGKEIVFVMNEVGIGGENRFGKENKSVVMKATGGTGQSNTGETAEKENAIILAVQTYLSETVTGKNGAQIAKLIRDFHSLADPKSPESITDPDLRAKVLEPLSRAGLLSHLKTSDVPGSAPTSSFAKALKALLSGSPSGTNAVEGTVIEALGGKYLKVVRTSEKNNQLNVTLLREEDVKPEEPEEDVKPEEPEEEEFQEPEDDEGDYDI
jgi:hypothetical protein